MYRQLMTSFFVHPKKGKKNGAGEGNRTLDASLGSSNFTIKLHLQIDIEIMYVIILRMAELVK